MKYKDLNELVNIDDEDATLLNGCKYIEPSAIDQLSGKNFKLRILHMNICSVNSKSNRLRTLLDTLRNAHCEIDVILLCETYFTDSNVAFCHLDGYTLTEKHRKSSKGGGVGIYVRKNIKFVERSDLSVFIENQFESIFIEIPSSDKPLVIGELYKPPNTKVNPFIENYRKLIETVDKEKKDIVIGTDQNLDLLNVHRHKPTSEFLELNLTTGLLPMITKPTRITHTSATLIDNIYAKAKDAINSESAILVTDISDHFPCLLMLRKDLKKCKENITLSKRDLNEQTISNINEHLSQFDWPTLIDNCNANDSYNIFDEKIQQGLEKHAPLKTKTISKKYIIREKWMTVGLVKSSLTCDKLYKKSLSKPKDHPQFLAYIEYRNKFNSLKRVAKKNYYCQEIEKYKKDSSKLWSTLKDVIGKKKKKNH